MILGKPGTEQYRLRVGLVFLAAGLALVIWAWGSWVYRASVPGMTASSGRSSQSARADAPASGKEAAPADRKKVARSLTQFLLWGSLLVLVFLVGSFVVVRILRNYRQQVLHKPASPTDTTDVWAMHKVPEDYDDEEEEPGRIDT